MNDVFIGLGNLAGKGVYANKNFKTGEIVTQYNLKSISNEEYEILNSFEKQFVHKHFGELFLYSEPERYVNHSNDPNTKQDLVNKCDLAIEDIDKGEMITTDAKLDDI